ncbi:FkbM family methyltransferase [Rhizobium sp. RU36D]|uniref:FkbM family methyltransferase n=1 Tax=Rhizobium sp. RU36D TaxID=1907415 RepID=UPI0009D90349|nr:FkbM family methyltransferase [Rhizobium sp. RU36D]SMC94134.1 methyltransferase, FkbM family [Rhizobium sp. RU36D]
MSDTKTRPLIYDLGMNNGDDTEYYLRRGFRVLAIEANPGLCEAARQRFQTQIEAGDLTILHAAIWQHSGETVFFVNVDNDHWSSIDINWAGRDDSRCQEITVRCVTLLELFETYGVPHTLKIDVEGVDLVVLQQLASAEAVPAFLSVEDCRFGFDYLRILAEVGYTNFKLLDQSKVPDMRDDRLGHQFRPGSSGPLGEDIPGGWMDYDTMVELYATTVRDRQGTRIAPRTQWFDIHARKI